MTAENRRAVLDGYVEIENLQNQIEGLDKNDPQLLILKEQLKEVQYDTAEIIKAEKTTARVTKIMKDVGKAKEVVILDDLSAKERKALRKSQGFGDRTTGIFGEDGKIYIGKTNNLKRRINEHFSGMGSKVTQKFKPLKYEILEVCDGYFSNKQEQHHTKKNIKQHGYENVRGGKYTNSRTLHKSQR